MSLSDKQKSLIRSTFAQIRDTDYLASRFYKHLFEIDPSTEPLFRGDMTEQRKKLMQTLAVVVKNLDGIETLIPAIQELGQRHAKYGVTVAHWQSVGAALLWALDEELGLSFKRPVREAWAAAYTLIAEVAMTAAYPHFAVGDASDETTV